MICLAVKGSLLDAYSHQAEWMPSGAALDLEIAILLDIGLATMPIGIAGLALSDLLNACNSPLRHLSVIGWACVAMAILLGITELCARHRRVIGNATLADALLIGAAQIAR